MQQIDQQSQEMLDQSFQDVRNEISNRHRFADGGFTGIVTAELAFECTRLKSCFVESRLESPAKFSNEEKKIDEVFSAVLAELAHRVRTHSDRFFGKISLEMRFVNSICYEFVVGSSFRKIRPNGKT